MMTVKFNYRENEILNKFVFLCVGNDNIKDVVSFYNIHENVILRGIRSGHRGKYIELACSAGNFDIFDILLTIYNSNDLPIPAQYLFISACQHGHLNIAKKVLNEFQHVDIVFPEAYRLAMNNNHIHIKKWLLTKIE